jgi:hypothetical protein
MSHSHEFPSGSFDKWLTGEPDYDDEGYDMSEENETVDKAINERIVQLSAQLEKADEIIEQQRQEYDDLQFRYDEVLTDLEEYKSAVRALVTLVNWSS